MSPINSGIVAMIALFSLMALGMPIGFCMLLIGFTGLVYLIKFNAAFHILSVIPFEVVSNYDYCVLPLFLFMASICLVSGLAKGLYHLVYVWLGQLPGGLAIATIGACAIFSAASASSIATAVTIGQVAIPEMRAYKYDVGLATGCVAAGGTLGILIPPSGVLIIYGIVTQQSITKLFVAGIIPGLILSLLFMLMIYIRTKLNQEMAPKGQSTSIKDKIKTTSQSFEMIFLLILVVVGLILGWFTPTEAGAIGAFGAIILSLIRKKLSWKGFREAGIDTIYNTGMIFTIILGAFIFNSYLALSTIPMELAQWVSNLGFPPVVIMVIIIIFYMILGCFIDAMSMILLTIPIFVPVASSLGFDIIWFGIIIVVVAEMAMITPPVGMNVFVISGIARDVPLHTIFKGVLPFAAVEALLLVLLIAFPQIALFLPGISG